MAIKREKYIRVRLSDEEKENIEVLAELKGISVADYIRNFVKVEINKIKKL